MCMSMLKYAIDSLREMPLGPDEMLHHLNRIVGRNIDPSMFVTMLYGSYDTHEHCFRYAVAGHEPGFCTGLRKARFTIWRAKAPCWDSARTVNTKCRRFAWNREMF